MTKNISSVYVIRCSSFYKIGYSKNPKSRQKTIQTHCPLKVDLIATFKTHNFVLLESELHNLFSLKSTRGEWFELNTSDLLKLKIEYGFSFKKDISKLTEDDTFSYNSDELKSLRLNNEQMSVLKTMFEEYFDCEVLDLSVLKYCHRKYGFEACENAILDLYNQGYSHDMAMDKIKKFASYSHKKINNPAQYLTDIAMAIYRNHYRYPVDEELKKMIYEKMVNVDDVDTKLKQMNSQKFYLKEPVFWDKIICNE